MGILDFLKKGTEKPVAQPSKTATPPNSAAKPDVKKTPDAQPSAQLQQEVYVVKAGDSLSKIALKYYGDMKQWNKIFEANKNQISNPDKIQIGQKLIIPKK